MRTLVAATSLAALLTSGCIFGRPNPQIDEIDYGDGETAKFDYDDDGYLVEVKRSYGEGSEPSTYELEWKDGLLVKITYGAGTDQVDMDLEHDDQGRLESLSTQGDGFSTSADFTYDDKGRFERYKATTENESFGATTTKLEAEYDDEGASEEWTFTYTSGDNEGATSKTTFEFEGTRLMKHEIDQEGGYSTETEYSYDDKGRPEQIERTNSANGESGAKTDVEVTYDDDGFVEGWTTETSYPDQTETSKDEVEISYGEGDARGLDMAPGEVLYFFDVKGGTYNTLTDVKTQVPRLFLNW